MSSIGIAAETAPDQATQGTQGVDAIVRIGIAVFALYFFAIAALMVFAPGFFFAHIGPFGARNDHYIRDTATFNAAFGAGLAIAYWRASWRVPVLCCVTVQFALHTGNHLVDIDAAHPHWLGPADFASLALSTVLLGFILAGARVKSGAPGINSARESPLAERSSP